MFIPDYRNIVNAAKNLKTARIPLYEHTVSPKIMEKLLNKKFSDLNNGSMSDKNEYYKHHNNFFPEFGYDAVSWECWLGPVMPGSGSLGGHKEGEIQNRGDFEKYPWDSVEEIFFNQYRDHLEAFGNNLPKGTLGIGGVGNGLFECVQEITGFENLCYIRADDEKLFGELFAKTADLMAVVWTRFLREYGDLFCVCRIGDDLGFKSNTLLTAEDIKKHIIPQYRRFSKIIHNAGKPFLLHSCGCIFSVMDDFIEAGIDAKHSNEDVISPYSRWIDDYGDRIGNFGGIDTDILCQSSRVDTALRTAEIYKLCAAKGKGAAIGSGNSIPDYVSPEKYTLMIDTVRKLRND